MHTFVPKIILLWKSADHHQNWEVFCPGIFLACSQWHKSNKDWKSPAQAAATDDSIRSFPTPAWHRPLRRFGSPHYTLQALFPWFDGINVFTSKPHLCLHLVWCPAVKRKYVINFREHWSCWCWTRWCFSITCDLLTCLTDNFILLRCPKS